MFSIQKSGQKNCTLCLPKVTPKEWAICTMCNELGVCDGFLYIWIYIWAYVKSGWIQINRFVCNRRRDYDIVQRRKYESCMVGQCVCRERSSGLFVETANHTCHGKEISMPSFNDHPVHFRSFTALHNPPNLLPTVPSIFTLSYATFCPQWPPIIQFKMVTIYALIQQQKSSKLDVISCSQSLSMIRTG